MWAYRNAAEVKCLLYEVLHMALQQGMCIQYVFNMSERPLTTILVPFHLPLPWYYYTYKNASMYSICGFVSVQKRSWRETSLDCNSRYLTTVMQASNVTPHFYKM